MNQMKNAKRGFATIICLILMFTMMLPFTSMVTFAAGDGMDVILVVDDTRSMLETDPNKLSSVAINKFVEKLPAGADIRLGITTYSVDIMPGSLELGQNADSVKNFSKTNITQGGKGTDAAVGLNWAVNQLETKSDDTRRKAIILIGDGENSYVVNNQAVRTDADSNNMLNAAIATAQSKGIEVYTLAMNPTADNFRQYFANIASSTGGKSFEPKTPEDLDGIMDEIFTTLTGADITKADPVDLQAGQPVTQTFDVPDGVFEMNLQCDHQKPIEIYFTDPSGTTYNEGSEGVTVSKEKTYTNFKIHEPVDGKWSVTYKSDIQQTITPQFIFHADLTVSLSKNQNDIMQKKPVQYIATIMTKGNEITDDNSLSGFDAKLVITEIDDQGNAGKSKSEKMEVKSGKFVLDYAIDNPGKYEIYAELVGDKSSIKSNTLAIDVAVDPTLMPLWQKLAIGAGILLLLIILFLLYQKMTSGDGTGQVRGNVSIKIVGRQANDETMIFPQDRFDCLQIFSKKNTLSDLVNAYVRRYRINNSSELAEMSLTQFINSTLNEVTDKVSICGNKKKQTIVRIPAGFDMQVDGMDISKPKALIFNSPEKAIEIRFKNQGCSYTINLIFTKA